MNSSTISAIVAGVLSFGFTARASAGSGATPPSDSVFHVDASDTNTMTIVEEGGTKYVTRWNDADGRDCAAQARTPRPFLNSFDGKTFVDFGTYNNSPYSDKSGYGASMSWTFSDKSIREVYLVYSDVYGSKPYGAPPWDDSDGGAFLLGTCGGLKNNYDFHRQGLHLFHGINSKFVNNSLIQVDGVMQNYDYELPEGFHVLRLRPEKAVSANAFATDRDTMRKGGQRLAEVIVYDRQLTDEEAKQTTDYLLDKWGVCWGVECGLGLTAVATVQNATASFTVTRIKDTLESDEPRPIFFSVAEDGTPLPEGVRIGALRKGESLVYQRRFARGKRYAYRMTIGEGEGAVASEDRFFVSGVVREPPAVLANASVHFDASEPTSMTTVKLDGTNYVQSWTDLASAITNVAQQHASYPLPFLSKQNGRSVVDFGTYNASTYHIAGYGAALLWTQGNGSIREVMMVYSDVPGNWESTTGGPTFLGWTQGNDFPRVGTAMSAGGGALSVQGSIIQVDGVARDIGYKLPEGFHVLRLRTGKDARANAFGYSQQGEGGQRIAEVIIFNNTLSEDDVNQVTQYLMTKWMMKSSGLVLSIY